MAMLVRMTSFSPSQETLRKELVFSSIVHDIGHAPYGHASERAINHFLNAPDFSNDTQSARILYYAHDQSSLPIFKTAPLPLLVGIVPPMDLVDHARPSTCKEPTLELLDDLENIVGDTGDLSRNAIGYPTLARELGVPERFTVAETPLVADRILRRFCPDRSYESLVGVSARGSSLRSLLAVAREEIDAIRQGSRELTDWDAMAYDRTLELCERVAAAMRDLCDCEDQDLVDIVSATIPLGLAGISSTHETIAHL
jgi:dGTPase